MGVKTKEEKTVVKITVADRQKLRDIAEITGKNMVFILGEILTDEHDKLFGIAKDVAKS